jgi:hypothetical protein
MADSSAPPPGFSVDETGRRRWWSGTGWTEPAPDSAGVVRAGRPSEAQLRDILDRAVSKYLEHGYSVRSIRGRRAVVTKRQRVNVLLNLLLALVTGGLWLIVLAVRLLNWPTDRVVLTIDDRGETCTPSSPDVSGRYPASAGSTSDR